MRGATALVAIAAHKTAVAVAVVAGTFDKVPSSVSGSAARYSVDIDQPVNRSMGSVGGHQEDVDCTDHLGSHMQKIPEVSAAAARKEPKEEEEDRSLVPKMPTVQQGMTDLSWAGVLKVVGEPCAMGAFRLGIHAIASLHVVEQDASPMSVYRGMAIAQAVVSEHLEIGMTMGQAEALTELSREEACRMAVRVEDS
jgi:hypothetical protein